MTPSELEVILLMQDRDNWRSQHTWAMAELWKAAHREAGMRQELAEAREERDRFEKALEDICAQKYLSDPKAPGPVEIAGEALKARCGGGADE